ncbi:MAG: hypothetical protein WB791_09640 [Waddliaceae bacterium]
MTLIPAIIKPSLTSSLETFEQAKAFQANLVWKKLDEITLEEALSHWLSTLTHKTQINYRSGIRKLFARLILFKHTSFLLQFDV